MANTGLSMQFNVNTSGTTFVALGRCRTRSIEMNGETVDVTTADATDRYRRLLAGAGVKSMRLTAAFVAIDNTAQEKLQTDWQNNAFTVCNFTIPQWGQYQGDFQVTNLSITGEHNGAVTGSVTVESAGSIAYLAA